MQMIVNEKRRAKFKKSMPKQMKIIIGVSWMSLTIILTRIKLRQAVCEQFMLFETLRKIAFQQIE